MAQDRGDMCAKRGARAIAWYTEIAGPLEALVLTLDGGGPLAAVAAQVLYARRYTDDDRERAAYRAGIRELGRRLPPGPWDRETSGAWDDSF